MKKEYSMKLFWIGFLGLMLCIPLALISNLADERRQRREAVALQLGRVWGGAQLIAMPFLSKQPNAAIDQMSFSSNVDIKGKQSVEIRKKGTYQIPFYNLDLDISGKVSLPASKDKTYYLVFPVSSLLRVSVESAKYGNKPIKQIKNDSRFIAFKIVPETDEEEISYELKVKLTGMEKFHILPMANNIRLEIDSNWGDPSFTGRSLPDTRTIDKNGFTAVDGYHLINRVIKYGFLFIGLTLAGFFVFEAIYSLRVHLIQYIFVGFALLLFYLLLLSFSEYIGFAFAYLIAALAVLVQIYGYAIVVLRSKYRAFVLGSGISILYGFLYILINLEEYSLVTGSIGLFLLLSGIMYFTRNVDWYSLFGNSDKIQN